MAMDFDARVTVADVAGAVSNAHEAAGKFIILLGDASRHVQVLDGGVPDKAEWGACIFNIVVHVVDRQCVSVAVEGATEVHVLATTHHLGRDCREGFRHRDVGRHLEEHAAVGAGVAVHVGAQRAPVGLGADLIRVVSGASAAAELRPSRLSEGEEGEKKE